MPRSYLDTRFGHDLFLKEAQEALQHNHLPLAVDELGLRPVSTPKVEGDDLAAAAPYVFSATFATFPEIRLPETAGLAVTVPPVKPVSEDDVQHALDEIREQFGVLGELAGDVVSDGDLVRVKEGEQEWDTRAVSDNPITQRLIGASIGSTVDIDTELSNGHPFKTTLEVVGLRQIILPEIDDDLAKDAGYDDLAALKADIEEKIGKRRADAHRQWVHAAVLEAVLEKIDITLPDVFVDELTDEELARRKESFQRAESNRTYAEYLEQREQPEEELKSEMRASIQHRLKRELVLQQLAADLGISIDENELGELADQEAAEYGEDPVRFTARLKAEDRWDDYRVSKVNERILATLTESAIITQKEES